MNQVVWLKAPTNRELGGANLFRHASFLLFAPNNQPRIFVGAHWRQRGKPFSTLGPSRTLDEQWLPLHVE